jgi:hypothetical protein
MSCLPTPMWVSEPSSIKGRLLAEGHVWL